MEIGCNRFIEQRLVGHIAALIVESDIFVLSPITSVLHLAVHCSRLSGLEMFPHLEELVLDNNAMTEDVLDTLPQLPNLTVLSLNKNQV